MKEITIELTHRCRAECIMCARKKAKRDYEYMPFEKYKCYLEEIVQNGYTNIVFSGMGEPLLAPDFIRIVKYTKSNYPDLYLRMATTGAEMNQEMQLVISQYIDEVKISHYGFTENTYKLVHGVNMPFQRIRENIESLININKRNCKIVLNYIELECNRHETQQWIRYWENFENITIEVWKPHNWGGNIDSNKYNSECCICYRVQNECVTLWCDGTISACCFDVNKKLVLGNLNIQKLKKCLTDLNYIELKEKNSRGEIYKNAACISCDQITNRDEACILRR